MYALIWRVREACRIIYKDMAEKEFSWKAPEFHYYEKGPAWYAGSVFVTGVLALLALWQGNFLFVVFVLIAEFLILFWARRKPRTIVVSLSEEGLALGERDRYPFERLLRFAVVEERGGGAASFREVVMETRALFGNSVRFMVPRESVQSVKVFLGRFLPETTHEESLAEYLSHFFRF